MPKKRIILAPFLLIVVLITSLYIHPPEKVLAANGVEAEINKTTGDLTFELTAAPASSSTTPHWKTVGFYITKEPTGKNGKKDAKASDCIFFDSMPKGCKKDQTKKDGLIYTSFTIPYKYVKQLWDKAGVDYKSLQKTGDKLYLQGVLQGYKPSTGKNLTERCYTYSQMRKTRYGRTVNGHYWSGIGWSNSCDWGWQARYDIPVNYVAQESPVTFNYYQWYKNKWRLVASLTNSNEGRIEKDVNGNYFTRNINKAGSDSQWQSDVTGRGTLIDGNGLGLKGNGKKLANGKYEYNGLYYYGRKPISTSYKCIPNRLSAVISTGSENTYGNLSKYYLYCTKVSKINSRVDHGARTAAKGTKSVRYKGQAFVDKSGEFTQEYLNWLPKARQDFDILDGNTIINVFYKTKTSPEPPESDENSISDSHLVPNSAKAIIQADNRGNESFDSTVGIPTSETQYVNLTTDNFLYKYKFTRYYGKNTFSQYIKCTHSERIYDPETGGYKKNPVTGEFLTNPAHPYDTKPVEREYLDIPLDLLRTVSAFFSNYFKGLFPGMMVNLTTFSSAGFSFDGIVLHLVSKCFFAWTDSLPLKIVG